MAEQRVVCVLGMHRSGTSLVTRLLNLLGVYLGPEEHLMPPAENNPSGFWEHQLISDLNEEIFVRLGGSWYEPPDFPLGWESDPALADLRARARGIIRDDFGDARLWGWKDPRACLTLPFWRRLLPPMRYILCFRNPIDIAASIERNYHFEHGPDLWLNYVRASLEHSSGAERLLVLYDQAMRDPQRELERIAAFIGKPASAKRPKVRAAIEESVDQGLWHYRSSLVDLVDDERVPFSAKALYLALCSALQSSGDGKEVSFDAVLEPFASSSLRARSAQRFVEAAVEDAERHAEESEQALAGVRQDLGAREAVLADRERELATAQAEVARRDADLLGHVGAITELRAELDDRSQELTALRDRFAADEAEAAERVNDLEHLRNDLERLRADLGARSVEKASLQDRLVQAEGDAVDHERALAAAQAELAAKEEELVQAQERLRPKPARSVAAARSAATRAGSSARCSIVIPVFNKASLTQACLDSLIATPRENVDFEIVVVDDASTDSTPELLAQYGDQIRVVTHVSNAGFAASCNSGAAAARGDYLVFLNNDTLPQRGWLEALVAYAQEHERAAVVGSKLLFPDNTVQHAGVVIAQDGYPRHIYAGLPAAHPAVNSSRRYQIVTAASMLVTRSDFDDVGGFDTAFHNGYEDVDLCLRLGERGREVHYCHESVLYHLESASRQLPTNGQLPTHEVEHNTRLYLDRWADRVQTDDLGYYLKDGLLRIGYSELFPLQLAISPQLAVILDGDREVEADRLLRRRSHQVYELLRDTIRLNVRATEAEFQAGRISGNGHYRSSVKPAPVAPKRIAEGDVHWLSSEPSGRLISVILPVKNGAERLRELLPRVLGQQTRDSVEIVAVDSGSEDDTVDVLREFGATVIAIDPAAFNHGLTRNLAASFARGEIFVYLNQSALPADESWLPNLVSQLDADPLVAGVCSRVLPREDADLLTRRDGLRDPSASSERQLRMIENAESYELLSADQLRLLINFHTVSAAIRPEVLYRIPFQNVLMGEDLLWAKEVLEAKLKIQHEPTSVVLHSHAYSHADLLRRNVDDGFANREIVGRRLEEAQIVPMIDALVREDWRYLEEECELDFNELERWRLEAALRRSAQIVGQWLGVNHEVLPDDLLSLVSLTERIREGAPLGTARSKDVADSSRGQDIVIARRHGPSDGPRL